MSLLLDGFWGVLSHALFSFHVLIRQIVLLIPASATQESPVRSGTSDSMFPNTDIKRNTSAVKFRVRIKGIVALELLPYETT